MKTRYSKVLTLLLAFVVQTTIAQNKTISGTVTDDNGLPLPGVNIIKKGSSSGTQSDFDGNYRIKISSGDKLSFSFVGFLTQEVSVGSQDKIDIQLQQDTAQLDEVVVTALGITREKKSLGYATQEVKEEALNVVKTDNFVNSLSGQVSGIQIKRTNNLGGSTNVVIRGNTSLTGNNQALFVVDGIVISNSNFNTTSQSQGGVGYDYGNAASDINPDNIETINVLKGAAATALYGSRAGNGAIIITTKKGNKNKSSFGVTLNSGVTMGSIDKSTFVKYQDQYGGGYGPFYGPDQDSYLDLIDINNDGSLDFVTPLTEDASYGAAFDPNLLVYQWDAFYPESPNYLKPTPWVNAQNGPISFFETPVTISNSVSIEKGFDSGSFRLSYNNFDQSGLLPNSSLKRNNMTLNTTIDMNDKLTVIGTANYTRTSALGRNSTGYGDNIVGSFRQWWQTNVDLKDLKQAYELTGRNITWNPKSYTDPSPQYWDNPYWTRYENFQTDVRNRFIGSAAFNYKVTDWLDGFARVTVDNYDTRREERRAIGSIAAPFGIGTGADGSTNRSDSGSGYSRTDITASEFNYDFMLKANKDLTQKLNLNAIVGLNVRRQYLNSIFSATNGGLNTPNLYALSNSASTLLFPVERDEKIGVDGVYTSVSLGYDDFLFLEGTFRKDRSSTLPKENNSYHYPSIATSFIFSKFIQSDWLTFGKVRLNYAEVSNDFRFGRLAQLNAINPSIGGPSSSVGSTLANSDLKPEETASYEAGLEMSFLQKRVGFDIAYYKTNTVNQLATLAITPATGFSFADLNAGEIENRGVELSLFGTPIETTNFSWNINVNWAQNTNEVISLADGISNLQLGNFQGGISINARTGQPYGIIAGTDYTYLNGQRVVDPSNGRYIKTSTSDQNIGNVNPDWTGGINNKFTYKNLSFSFLIDIQKGGDIFSLDRYYGLSTGLYDDTTFINDLGNPVRNSLADGGGFINPGVNPDGTVNTTRIAADRYGPLGFANGLPNAAFVYDASFVKLRQASLAYSVPTKILEKSFINNLTLSLIGSNLWIISKNFPDADPESGLGAGNLQGYSTGSLPTTRDYGFNVKVQF